ncbi:KilA-N domain-containing protein [Neisseria animalis]|uniref:KilA-N domain-containing protein n=1 Tax=Neisseria animalis TaxID=492 RepID=A0A5P3MT53_NEIAN|nr:KilA-N domain-containing protein [Neisseria animalis]QEY24783.1 KilA-N domain-containing protein [Neisseria animalis]ROW31816.1 KilA-N domain-containing protein [Neisseria animalis]VEE07719.1 putative phage related protein [Neisseria animalis]
MNAIQISSVAIRQTSNRLYNLNDLHKASGGEKRHELTNWLKLQQTNELIDEISKPEISGLEKPKQVIQVIRGGANRGTYACKELVYAYATWISAKFFLQVIRTFDAVVSGRLQTQPQKALPNGLTREQQAEVKAMHNLLVQSVPFEKQKALAITLWSAIKAKFKSGYKDIPPEQFPEILSLMARVAVAKGAQYREEAEKKTAATLETVPKLYRNQANIPFNLNENAEYRVIIRDGKIYRHQVHYSTFPFEDRAIPCLKHMFA